MDCEELGEVMNEKQRAFIERFYNFVKSERSRFNRDVVDMNFINKCNSQAQISYSEINKILVAVDELGYGSALSPASEETEDKISVMSFHKDFPVDFLRELSKVTF